MHWKKNMQPLDWSCLNDVLIEDEEGDIRPMGVPYFKEKKLADGVWQVLSDGDYRGRRGADPHRWRHGPRKHPGILPEPVPGKASVSSVPDPQPF